MLLLVGFADRTANTALLYGVDASRQATGKKIKCLYLFYMFWSLATANNIAMEEHLEVTNKSCARAVRLYFGRYRYARCGVWDSALTNGLPRGLRSHVRPNGPNDKAEQLANDARLSEGLL